LKTHIGNNISAFAAPSIPVPVPLPAMLVSSSPNVTVSSRPSVISTLDTVVPAPVNDSSSDQANPAAGPSPSALLSGIAGSPRSSVAPTINPRDAVLLTNEGSRFGAASLPAAPEAQIKPPTSAANPVVIAGPSALFLLPPAPNGAQTQPMSDALFADIDDEQPWFAPLNDLTVRLASVFLG
jgi:hypothetical protein